MPRLLLLSLALVLVANVACIPNVARTNAHIEPGFELAVGGGSQVARKRGGDGTTSSDAVDKTPFPHLELDVQYGSQFDNRYGMAIQLKVPIAYILTSLDLFLELPSDSEGLFFGIGAELGVVEPALYATITKNTGDFYISFTPRVHVILADAGLLVNSQLSVGLAGFPDVVGFVSLAFETARGYNPAYFVYHQADGNQDPDYREDYGLVGMMLRF